MSSYGFFAGLVALVAAMFIGFLLWRGDTPRTPAAGYWSFAILCGFVSFLFVVQDTDIPTPWGSFHYARTAITTLEKKVEQLEKAATSSQTRWALLGEGVDCPGNDAPGGSSEGPKPLDEMCKGNVRTAVCWDGQLYRNGGARQWCTYKIIDPNQCVGGTSPGRIYQCQPKT